MSNFIPRWAVIFVDPFFTESMFRRWMYAAGVPACWSFYVDPFGQITNQLTSYGTFPFPSAPNSISIFRGSVTTSNVVGICLPDQHKCCIGVWDGDTDIDIGARIWHEISHAQNLNVDDMKTTYREEFHKYLVSSNSLYADFYQNPDKYDALDAPGHSEILCAFYTFLTEKYFGCECFQDGCTSSIDVQPDSGTSTPISYGESPSSTGVVDWINKNPIIAAGAVLIGLCFVLY